MVIQHNMAAMFGNRELGITTGEAADSAEKLSSGYKINRAADDAAGLKISEKMRSQIRGLDRAAQNIQEGISLTNVADGALTEIHSMLQRERELLVQAANDTNTSEDRDAIEQELTALSTEFDRIFDTTEFNGRKIFKGQDTLLEGPTVYTGNTWSDPPVTVGPTTTTTTKIKWLKTGETMPTGPVTTPYTPTEKTETQTIYEDGESSNNDSDIGQDSYTYTGIEHKTVTKTTTTSTTGESTVTYSAIDKNDLNISDYINLPEFSSILDLQTGYISFETDNEKWTGENTTLSIIVDGQEVSKNVYKDDSIQIISRYDRYANSDRSHYSIYYRIGDIKLNESLDWNETTNSYEISFAVFNDSTTTPHVVDIHFNLDINYIKDNQNATSSYSLDSKYFEANIGV